MVRLASRPAIGPAVSSSPPSALAPLAPELSAPAPAAGGADSGAGFGRLLAQPPSPSAAAINTITMIRRIRLSSSSNSLSRPERPPCRLAHLALLRLEAQPGQSVN